MQITGAKFSTMTKYGKHLFSVGESCPEFKELLRVCKVVESDYKFQPIYAKTINDKKFISIIIDNLKYKITEKNRGSSYDITLEFRRVEVDDRVYLNIYADTLKLVKAYKNEHVGKVVEF